ncbi:hypothetical protein BDN70DRAFT_794043 [Pholiota conissans]|uniref:SMP-LTD domain-containing protein n=1 Tax=Pholiota conissans TaxID=109636 RepID=A0A9P6D0I1_9AGAR|nr:hypothetical protein BDN70DRAFT_794043 [Pholiota conissans]
MLRALLYAYVLGGLTFIPLVIGAVIFITIYTSVPIGDADITKRTRKRLEATAAEEDNLVEDATPSTLATDTNDIPRTRKSWLTMRRTFEESAGDGGYVTLVRSFLDSRSKDPKRSRPKDMWYVVLKGKVLYLYEDEEMTECEAAVELSSHQVIIYPESLPDGELFAKRNAICLRPRTEISDKMPSVTRQMQLDREDTEGKVEAASSSQKEAIVEAEKEKDAAREEALDTSTPWFIFVRSNIEMEDWYFSLIHASEHPAQAPTLGPLSDIFDPNHMDQLISTLDEQPDVIPMRWLNALLGRIFLSHYRTHNLEAFIIGRLMKKLSKVKRPAFLTEISVTQVSVGNKAPMLSKPMLKELTKEGDASIEVHMKYKGEVRITVEATAVINLGARFKSYTVKLELAAVLKELEGNLLIKVKRPPSNRIWYAFTQSPRIVLEVEPIVSDRQITWGMILSTIESKFKEILQESIVMPNMDDIAFFETGFYEHRGGIFADTRRKPPLSPPETPPIPDDIQSVASAPLPDASSIFSGDSKSMASDEPPVNPVTRAATDMPPSAVATAIDELEDSPRRNSVKRRSWFNSAKSDDAASSPTRSSTYSLFASEQEESRGRTLETESTSSSRSQSTPKPVSVRASTPEPFQEPESEASKSKISLLSQGARRASTSHGSVKDNKEIHHETPKIIVQNTSTSTPNTPRKSLDSQPPRPSSPPSFFSTLKSKAAAADKQAISNTAKEAMRKWGVNWGGFKKDASASDDSSHAGTSPPRSLLQAEGTALLNKARTSYAEVRAAVAERKERDRTSHHDDDSDVSRPTSPAATRTRAVSTSKPVLPNGSVYSESPINPSIVTSAARLAPRLTSKKSTPSLGRVNTEADTQELPAEPVKHAPIHVQPVAKTMSIPGIHASHRGDVQSMGHVAQPPSPPPVGASSSSSSSGPSEAMLKNPAIQTVYRLWKNPGAGQGFGHSDTEAASTARPTTAESAHGDSQLTNGHAVGPSVPELQPAPTPAAEESGLSTKAASTSAAASPPPAVGASLPAPQPLLKPTPPPLPPRASSAVVQPAPITQAPAEGSSSVPSASQTLKAVALRDAESSGRAVHTPVHSEVSEIGFENEDAETDAGKRDSLPTAVDDDVVHPQSMAMSVTPIAPGPPPALPPRRA